MVECNFQYVRTVSVLTGEPKGVYFGDLFDIVQPYETKTLICCNIKNINLECDQDECIFFKNSNDGNRIVEEYTNW